MDSQVGLYRHKVTTELTEPRAGVEKKIVKDACIDYANSTPTAALGRK